MVVVVVSLPAPAAAAVVLVLEKILRIWNMTKCGI